MSNLVLSQPRGTYKLTIYSYKKDMNTQILVVCHDNIPFLYENAQLVDSKNGYEECNPVAQSISLEEQDENLYENFIKSLPDSDPNKDKYQKSFAEDLKRNFFLLKVDTNLLNISREYIIRVFDKINKRNVLISNDIRGIRIKTGSFMEIYSFYVSIIENKSQENEQRTFGSICKEVCIYVIIVVIVRLFINFIFGNYD